MKNIIQSDQWMVNLLDEDLHEMLEVGVHCYSVVIGFFADHFIFLNKMDDFLIRLAFVINLNIYFIKLKDLFIISVGFLSSRGIYLSTTQLF